MNRTWPCDRMKNSRSGNQSAKRLVHPLADNLLSKKLPRDPILFFESAATMRIASRRICLPFDHAEPTESRGEVMYGR